MRARADRLALAALVVAATLFVAWFGLRVHGLVLFDEKLTVEGARWLEADLSRLLDMPGYADRGIERLSAVVLLPVFALFGASADDMVAGHVLVALLFALQGVAAWLIARGLGAGPRWSLVAAALSLLGPWAVFGITFLNTVPAATTTAFAIWAMWRATLDPSPGRDTLALVLLGLSALARVSHAGLALAFPVAVAVADWRDRPEGATRRDWALGFPARLARRHPVLLAAGLAGIALVALRGVGSLVGDYPTSVDASPGKAWDRLVAAVDHLGAGMAIVPVVLGLAWIGRQALRPASREAGAFAVLALALTASLIFVNLPGGLDERYELPLVMPVAVAFALSLARREAGLLATAAAALLVGYALHRHALVPFTSSIDYLNSPSAEWLSQVWIERVSDALGASRDLARDLVIAGGAAVAIALAAVTGRLRERAVVVTAVVTVAVGALGAGWAMNKLSGAFRPSLSFDQVTFVDRVTGGRGAAPLAHPAEPDSTVVFLWSELQYFNDGIERPVSVNEASYSLCCIGNGAPLVVAMDPASGLVTDPGGVPDFILTTPRWVPHGLAARPVHLSVDLDLPVRVERLQRPLQGAWSATGVDNAGWAHPEAPATVRAYPAAAPGAGDRCLRATIRAPRLEAGRESRWAFGDRRGRLPSEGHQRVDVPLGGDDPVDLALTARPAGVDPVSGARVTAGLEDLRVTGCGAPDPSPAG